MKAFLFAAVAVAVIGVGAWYGLEEVAPFSTAERQSAPSVRLD